MDNSAKAFWNFLLSSGHNMVAPQLHIAHEGWTLWHNGSKLTSAHTTKLYPLLEDQKTIDYWTSTHHLQTTPRLPVTEISNVDWDACRDFMMTLQLYDRRRIPKHASENCGVGITLKHWGKQPHDRCPRCDQPESALHVLSCRYEDSDSPWNDNISSLEDFLVAEDTHPGIQKAILHRLRKFRSNGRTSTPLFVPLDVKLAVQAQDKLGWNNILWGLPAKQWKLSQLRLYKRTRSDI